MLTKMESLLSEAIRQQREQIQLRDARITDLEAKLFHANARLRAAGFVNDINGERFEGENRNV
jgi:hypothetical protein